MSFEIFPFNDDIFDLNECNICFKDVTRVVNCQQCTFITCRDCYRRLKATTCPQCRFIGYKEASNIVHRGFLSWTLTFDRRSNTMTRTVWGDDYFSSRTWEPEHTYFYIPIDLEDLRLPDRLPDRLTDESSETPIIYPLRPIVYLTFKRIHQPFLNVFKYKKDAR